MVAYELVSLFVCVRAYVELVCMCMCWRLRDFVGVCVSLSLCVLHLLSCVSARMGVYVRVFKTVGGVWLLVSLCALVCAVSGCVCGWVDVSSCE